MHLNTQMPCSVFATHMKQTAIMYFQAITFLPTAFHTLPSVAHACSPIQNRSVETYFEELISSHYSLQRTALV